MVYTYVLTVIRRRETVLRLETTRPHNNILLYHMICMIRIQHAQNWKLEIEMKVEEVITGYNTFAYM